MNPANLRWRYLLMDIHEDEDSPDTRKCIDQCLDSLEKFPLVLVDVSQCRMLKHFNKEIISKMAARLHEQEAAEKNFSHNLQPLDDISPIGSKHLKSSSQLVKSIDSSYHKANSEPKLNSSSESDNNFRVENFVGAGMDWDEDRERRDQEEKDFQMALRLSQEFEDEENFAPNVFVQPRSSSISPAGFVAMTSPNTGACAYAKTGPAATQPQDCSFTEVTSHTGYIGPPSPIISNKHQISDSEEEDPFANKPRKKVKMAKPKSPKVKQARKSPKRKKPQNINPHNLSSDNDDGVGTDGPQKFISIFDQDPILARIAAASMSENPEPEKKKPRGRPKANNVQAPSLNNDLSSQSNNRPNKRTKKQTPPDNDDSGGSSRQRHPSGDELSSQSNVSNSKKEYLPKYRSGAYGILLALFYESQLPGYKGFMSKEEVCKKAGDYSDTDLVFSQAGSVGPQSWYTGWSSSRTLIEKGLIQTWSNPLKIKLTEEGKTLALKIAKETTEATIIHSGRSNSSEQFSAASWLNEVSLGANQNGHSNLMSNQSNPISNQSSAISNQFEFRYVTDLERLTESSDQNQAVVDIDDDVYYLVKCRKIDLEKSLKRFRIHTPSLKGDESMCVAYIVEQDCLLSECVDSFTQQGRPTNQSNDKPTIQTNYQPTNETKIKPKGRKKSKPPSPTLDLRDIGAQLDPATLENFHLASLPDDWRISKDLATPSNITHSEGFTLRAGQYEILLLVDAMEVTGGSHGGKKSRKAQTLEFLDSMQVRYECRKLNIGDFVWIAREKNSVGDPRELVLPYIVERKRLDDLRSSIMDGRYKEQKSRINQSGIKVKFYLVEEACLGGGPSGIKALDRNTLEQAISNTAIRDGFRVMRTKNQKDSCHFLSDFTNNLIRKYAGKNLRSTSIEKVYSESNWETSLLLYKHFHDHSRPDKSLCVREIFGNQLICMKGVTPQMAWAITKKYPTPLSLKTAYSRLDPEDADKLLVGLAYDNGSKKVSAAVSKIIARLFNENELK